MLLRTKHVSISGPSDLRYNLRIGLSRASLTVSKETGVEAFKGLFQERGCQCLVHGRLAREAGMTLINGPEGKVVNKTVHLSHAGMFHSYFFPVQEDHLGCFFTLLSLTSSTEKNIVTITILSIIPTECNKDLKLVKYSITPDQHT